MAEGRRTEIVRAARGLLEEEGEAALTMRRLADRLGIRAPSLYKHVPDKAELEVALVSQGLEEFGQAFRAAGPGLGALAGAYRSWALSHPHLYRLMNDRPLPRGRLPEGLEARAVGAQLIAPRDGEGRLLALAAQLARELGRPARRPPLA